jgi:hypothetical protein
MQFDNIPAIPYMIPPKPFDDSKITKLNHPSIEDRTGTYQSQTFMFRSSNEEVGLSDRAQ